MRIVDPIEHRDPGHDPTDTSGWVRMSTATWDRFESRLRRACAKKSVRTPFSVRMSDGFMFQTGTGEPRFTMRSRSAHGDRALTSMDLFQVGDAVIGGQLEVDGDIVAALAARK